MTRVLVICGANRSRSPLVAALLSRDKLLVKSAGLSKPGHKVAAPIREVARERFGLSLDEHRSQLVTQELINWAHMVVLMNMTHVDRLTRTYPKPAKQRWVRLGQYADPKIDNIPDLSFLQGKAFDDVVALIEAATINLSKELRNAV